MAQLEKHLNQWRSVVSSTPTGGNFIFLQKAFKSPRCQFCTEMSDLCYLRKPRQSEHLECFKGDEAQIYARSRQVLNERFHHNSKLHRLVFFSHLNSEVFSNFTKKYENGDLQWKEYSSKFVSCKFSDIFLKFVTWNQVRIPKMKIVKDLSLVLLHCTFTMYRQRVHSISQWWSQH